MHKEIERKFLVKTPPSHLMLCLSYCIRQGYLPSEETGYERRIRQKGGDCFLTVKSTGSLTRDEEETRISHEDFIKLWPLTEGNRIAKRRYVVPYNKRAIEVDIFSGDLEGLILAEVEFHSEKEAEKFIGPEWFGEEVTYDNRYKNKNLAANGIPKN